MKRKRNVVFLFILLFSYQLLQAQWQQTNGPLAAPTVNCLTMSGKNIFAGIQGTGIFMSTDMGETWNEVNTGLTDKNVKSLASDDNNVYAGTVQEIFRYSYSDNKWTPINKGLNLDSPVMSLAVFDTLLFAGTSYAGIYRSSNKGDSWVHVDSGYANTYITDFESVDNFVFASGSGGGILSSSDYGITWSSSNVGIPTNFTETLIFHDSLLIAGTVLGVFLSSDTGKTWNKEEVVSPVQMVSLNAVKNIIFAGSRDQGVLYSLDSGLSWLEANNGLPVFYGLINVNSFAVIDTVLFAATNYGIFKSVDMGASWHHLDLRTKITTVNAIEFGDNIIYAGTEDGVFYSINDGDDWLEMNKGLSCYEVNSLLKANNYLYAGTDRGLFLYDFNIQEWMLLNTSQIYCLAVNDNAIFAGASSGAYYSVDGKNFTLTNSPPLKFNSFAINNSTLFAVANYKIYRYSNSDHTWIAASNGLSNYTINYIVAIKGKLYASTSSKGVFYSENDGQDWFHMGAVLTNRIYWLYSLAAVRDTLFAATSWGVLLHETGTKWLPYNKNLTKDVQVINSNSNMLFAGTTFGVWRVPLTGITDVLAGSNIPSSFNLLQNYPNPFNPYTTISFSIPVYSKVILKVYDILGNEVTTLLNQERQPGNYQVTFDGSNYSSGIYFYKITAGKYSETKKCILLK